MCLVFLMFLSFVTCEEICVVGQFPLRPERWSCQCKSYQQKKNKTMKFNLHRCTKSVECDQMVGWIVPEGAVGILKCSRASDLPTSQTPVLDVFSACRRWRLNHSRRPGCCVVGILTKVNSFQLQDDTRWRRTRGDDGWRWQQLLCPQAVVENSSRETRGVSPKNVNKNVQRNPGPYL